MHQDQIFKSQTEPTSRNHVFFRNGTGLYRTGSSLVSLSTYMGGQSITWGWWLTYMRPSHTLCRCIILGAILLAVERVSVHSSAWSFCRILQMRPERLSAHFSFARLFARLFLWPYIASMRRVAQTARSKGLTRNIFAALPSPRFGL